jgi:predicted metal-binding membrane protein
VFSAAATAIQRALATRALVTPMMETASPYFAAALLAVAGGYQWSAAKRACLVRCRTPAAFITENWRRGAWGALRLGAAHGAYCVGCCWALMLLLFAGGVMSLVWIAGLSLFVLVEKLGPHREWADRAAGAGLVLAGAALALAQLVHG